MSARFEELDWRETPMGDISLRRRRDPASGLDVFEVKLDDDYLMSSLTDTLNIGPPVVGDTVEAHSAAAP